MASAAGHNTETTYTADSPNFGPLETGKSQAYVNYQTEELLRRLYQVATSELASKKLARRLDNGKRYEFEWALIEVKNMIEFKYIQDKLLKLYGKDENAKIEFSTYLILDLPIESKGEEPSNIRLRINNGDEIRRVLGDLEEIINFERGNSSIHKTRIYSTDDKMGHLNLRCRLAIESDSHFTSDVGRLLSDSKRKTFRLIKRMSISRKGWPGKLELSVVKQGRGVKPELAVKQLLERRETYSVEIDIETQDLGELDRYKDFVVEQLLGILGPHPLTPTLTTMAKWDLYLMLSNDTNIADSKSHLKWIRSRWFECIPDWGEMTNLRQLMSTVVNYKREHLALIYKTGRYAVTDKSDGVRYWLFANPVGDIFLVDMNFKCRLMASRTAVKSTLLDGELVTTRDGQQLYLIFDCMYANDNNTMSLKLLGKSGKKTRGPAVLTRLNNPDLAQVMANLKEMYENNAIEILCKIKEFQMLQADNHVHNLTVVRSMIDSVRNPDGLSYETDGLIFTLYDCNYYETLGGNPKDNRENGCYYQYSNIKWKPADKLSVDFLVEIESDVHGNHLIIETDGREFKQLKLIYREGGRSVVRTIIDWPIDDAKNPRCQVAPDSKVPGDIIYHRSVVEFIYNPTPGNLEWVPIKLRDDKTIHERPNAGKTLDDIVKSANQADPTLLQPDQAQVESMTAKLPECPHKPLDARERTFFGHDKITGNYKRDYYRSLLDLNYLVKFNTTRQAIEYIHTSTNTNYSQIKLVDLACGRANDWDSWNQLVNVYGFDTDEDNIATAMGQVRTHRDKGLKADFTQLDILNWREPDNQEKIKHLKGQADIVVCQFALHFFTKSQKDFKTWLDLVNFFLRDGGILLISTFDGHVIDKLLQNGVAVGLFGSEEQLLWQIVKCYDQLTTFGNHIKSTIVPLGAYQTNQEYLVNIDDVGGKDGIDTLLRKDGFSQIMRRPFLEFIQGKDAKYFNRSTHTRKAEMYRHVTSRVGSFPGSPRRPHGVTKHPNLSKLAEYHTVLMYQKGKTVSPPFTPGKPVTFKPDEEQTPTRVTEHPRPKPAPKTVAKSAPKSAPKPTKVKGPRRTKEDGGGK